MSTVKKVIVVPACTDLNRGDQALTWESVNAFYRVFNKEELDCYILDYGFTEEDRARQSSQTKEYGYKVIHNILQNPKRVLGNSTKSIKLSFFQFLAVSFVGMYDFIKSFLVVLFPCKTLVNALYKDHQVIKTFHHFIEADVIVYKGGGFLHVYGKVGDFYYLWYGLFYAILALRLGKKIVIMPNSIGPIEGWHCKMFARFVLKKISLLLIREKESLSYLASIGVENGRYFPDLGYFVGGAFDEFNRGRDGGEQFQKEDKLKIGITVRPYVFPKSINPSDSYSNYINSIVAFCNYYSDRFSFYFIVQVQGPSAHETDLLAIQDVVQKLNPRCEFFLINKNYNYLELMRVYECMDYLVGTRFHSVIFSHVVRVPALAIAYGGNKTTGIMSEIGLSEFVIEIESISASCLISKFERLVQDKNKYLEKLDRYLAYINSKKKSLDHLLKEVLK